MSTSVVHSRSLPLSFRTPPSGPPPLLSPKTLVFYFHFPVQVKFPVSPFLTPYTPDMDFPHT